MMKSLLALFSLVTVLLPLSAAFAAHHEKSEGSGPYRHVVLFGFKEDATQEQISEIEKAFAALPSEIEHITDYEWGTNVSPEGLNEGLTHCFFVTFKDKAGLEAYLPHPAHKAFVAKLKPILEKVVVVDYVAQ